MAVRRLSENKYQIDYYPKGRKGKRRRITFRGSEAAARLFESEVRIQPDTVTRINPQILDILPEYFDWAELHRLPSTNDRLKCSLISLLPYFGRTQVSRITPGMIMAYQIERKKKVTNKTVNNEINGLKAIITYMVKNEYCRPLSFKIEMLPYNRPIPKVPDPAAIQKMIGFIEKDNKKAMIYFMWQSGLRRREALSLKWENINWAEQIIYVFDTKGGAPRICLIPQKAFEIIKENRQEEGWLFENPKTGQPYKSIKKEMITACKKAGIKRITHHLLRHAFGSTTLEATGNLRTVQVLLGHKDIKTTQFYTQVNIRQIKRDTQKAIDYISQKTSPDKPTN